MRTLLLTPWMSPHRIISWERAVVLLVLGKVDVVSAYEDEVRGPNHVLPTPSVVRMKKGGPKNKPVVRFSRVNVFTRDGFRCQYCGEKRIMQELNYDHVVPRSKGGKTTWENIVTSCYPCNLKKGGRTPEEAGMTLAKRPVVPKSLPVAAGLRFGTRDVPETWAPYCRGLVGRSIVS